MNIKEKYRQFKDWQRKPHQVAPLNPQEHTCATCGFTFQGNYCPRCGQSARVGRYSLKTALLLFLDVWGLGNRGMFRSIRDLLLRPGYMIRDYLNGMQMAYFPPFKMFFLLATLSFVVISGLNIEGENKLPKMMESYELGYEASNKVVDQKNLYESEPEKAEVVNEVITTIDNNTKKIIQFIFNHQTLVELVWLLILSLPLYVFFRGCPAIPDLYYSEFFVAMVYITNLMNIISVIFSFFCMDTVVNGLISSLLSIVALKQFSGYSYLRTILNLVASIVIIVIASAIIIVLVGVVVGFIMAYNGA